MESENSAVPYTPNHIPHSTRLFYGFASAGLIAYGAFGLWIDDLYIPGKRGPGTHLHGPAAWLMAAAMLMGAINMASVIVDHLDQRNNETDYRRFAKYTGWAGYGLMGLSVLWFALNGLPRGAG